MHLYVKLLGSKQRFRRRLQPGESMTVGRSPESDLCLDDDVQVSRHHCELEAAATGLIVRDLESRNGTWLNGEKLDKPVFARPGDQIRIGQAHLLVERRERSWRPSSDEMPVAHRGRKLPDVPGYHVLARIGSGTSGQVYKARPTSGGPEIVLKLLDRAAPDAWKKRFERGAQALSRLDHPAIVRVTDVAVGALPPHYVMELLDGPTLRELVEQEPLGSREAISFGLQLARALGALHTSEMVHRDVCPDHVIVVDGTVAKLVGFDTVKDAHERSHGVTPFDEEVGNMTYASPEQAQDPRAVDARSDLYSLGATLYHALAGRPPFEGHKLAILRQVLVQPAPPIAERAPGIAKPLADIVTRLLRKDPKERFQSADELARAFERALMHSVSSAEIDAALLTGDADPLDRPVDPTSPTAKVKSKEKKKEKEAEKNAGVETQAEAAARKSMPVTSPPMEPDAHHFAGGFSGHELLEVVRFLELNTRSGHLVIQGEESRGQIHFRDGVIVRARCAGKEGEPAARRLLTEPAGTFEFHGLTPAEPPEEHRVRLLPSALAAEIAKQPKRR